MMSRLCIALTVICALLACGSEAPGDHAQDLYLQAPASFGPPEILPAIGPSSATPEGCEQKMGEASWRAPTGSEAEQSAQGNSATESAPDGTRESDSAAVQTVCGDGICGPEEPETCWVDCTESSPEAPDYSTPPSDPQPTPSEPAPANPDSGANSGDGPWPCVETQCAFEWDLCMSDPACAGLHQCMLGCSSNDACKDQCLANVGPLSAMKLDDVALCAGLMGCL